MPRIELYGDRYGFECPGCECVHAVPVSGERGWQFNGDLERPTLSPSLLVREYEGDTVVRVCHSFVRNGQIEFLSDCTHEHAGKTLPLREIDA